MPYSSEHFLDLFDKLYKDNQQELIENLRHNNVYGYRVKTFKCGNLLECEIFPIWLGQKQVREVKEKKRSRPEQENLNEQNAKKQIVRLTNLNFTKKDIWFTCTYDDEHLPENDEQAKRDILNWINRVKYRRRKLGLPELRYIYVTEGRPEKDDNGKPIIRYHHHVILSGDMDRDELEQMWHGGARREAHRLQPDDFEFTGLARYITKTHKKSKKRWGRSQNLKKVPKPTVADHKINKRQADKIARNVNAAPPLFEKIYLGYRFLDIKIKYSDFVSGAYLYVRMRKRDEASPKQKRCKGAK